MQSTKTYACCLIWYINNLRSNMLPFCLPHASPGLLSSLYCEWVGRKPDFQSVGSTPCWCCLQSFSGVFRSLGTIGSQKDHCREKAEKEFVLLRAGSQMKHEQKEERGTACLPRQSLACTESLAHRFGSFLSLHGLQHLLFNQKIFSTCQTRSRKFCSPISKL